MLSAAQHLVHREETFRFAQVATLRGGFFAALAAEEKRGADVLRLANALSALYPRGAEEQRLLDAMLLAVPRQEEREMRRKRTARGPEIRHMVRRIVKAFHPERIILFGSHARGTAGPDSDVDLLVVMPLEGSKRERQVEIRLALRGIRVPKDIIVSSPEEFAWRKDAVGTIEYPATREGKVLYARA